MGRLNRFSEEYRVLVASAPARRLEAIKSLIATLKKRGHAVKGGNQQGVYEYMTFTISVDGVEVDVSCKANNGCLRFVVGHYDLNKRRSQFPEPKAGFDFDKIAESVETWATYVSGKDKRRIEEQARGDEAKKAMKSLAKTHPNLKPYMESVSFDSAGRFHVDLRCETIFQVERVLLAALEGKVEP